MIGDVELLKLSKQLCEGSEIMDMVVGQANRIDVGPVSLSERANIGDCILVYAYKVVNLAKVPAKVACAWLVCIRY